MRSALLIAVTVTVAIPVAAEAKPKVAFVTFEGDKGNAVRDVVTDALGDDVALVSNKAVNRAVDRLGLDTSALAVKDLKKLSKDLSADAIIQASYTKTSEAKTLHFKLFVHGKKRKGFKVEFQSLKSKKFQQQLHDKMIERLDADGDGDAPAVAAVTKKSGDDDEDPIGGGKKKKKKGATGDDDGTALTTMKKKGDDDSDSTPPPEKKKVSDDDGEPHRKKIASSSDDDGDGASVTAHADLSTQNGVGHTANRDALRLDLGLSVQNRFLKFNSRNYPQAPKSFDQKPVPGARFALELFPLAFSSEGPASGLGIAGMFDQTVGLNLQNAGMKYPVSQRHIDIGLRYRFVFGHKATSPSVTLGVGYMQRQFVITRTGLADGTTIDVPDVKYAGYDPGLEFRIPLMERVAISLGGQAILLKSAGPIQELDSYGQAKITGGTGYLSIDIIIAKHVAFNLRGEATQIGYKFTGNGAMANNRDGDPTSIDVGGAADRYIGGVGTIAVLY